MSRTRRGGSALSLALMLMGLAAFGLLNPATVYARSRPSGHYAHPDLLASARWLKPHLHDPTVRIVAVTSKPDFARAHIPGAAQINWPQLNLASTSPAAVARWRKSMEQRLTRLGIRTSDTVVVYDGGTLFAARLWWVLDYLGQKDIRMLDGGLPAWKAAGGAIATGQSTVKPAATPYVAHVDASALAPIRVVKASLGAAHSELVDARSQHEYVDGHIPGAIHINYVRNASSTSPHFFKSADVLNAMYRSAGATPGHVVMPYCSTGVRSAVTFFTLRLIGYPHVRLYSGSWHEWRQHPELPKVTGDHP